MTDGRAAASVLDSYARERRPHLLRMTALADAMGAVVQTRRRVPAAARDLILSTLIRSGRVRTWVGAAASPRPGSREVSWRAPHTAIAPGRPCRSRRSSLPTDRCPRTSASAWARLGVTCVARGEQDAERVIEWWLKPDLLALVRPGRFAFGTTEPDGGDAPLRSLEDAPGAGPPRS